MLAQWGAREPGAARYLYHAAGERTLWFYDVDAFVDHQSSPVRFETAKIRMTALELATRCYAFFRWSVTEKFLEAFEEDDQDDHGRHRRTASALPAVARGTANRLIFTNSQRHHSGSLGMTRSRLRASSERRTRRAVRCDWRRRSALPGGSRRRQARSVGRPDVTAAAGERVLDVPGQLAEVRRLTRTAGAALFTARLHRLAVHRWMNGETIADGNRERLARLHAALRYIDRGNTEDNRAALDMAIDGSTAAGLLAQGRFDEVKAVTGKGSGRPHARWAKVRGPPPDPDDHWYVRLVNVVDDSDNGPVRAKPQTFKHLRLRKG